MNKKIPSEIAIGFIIFLALIVVVIILTINKDGTKNSQQVLPNVSQKSKQSEKTKLANPASVFCIDQGGKNEIRTNSDGSQAGYCIFKDNGECEEWAYFRGECVKKGNEKDNWQTYKDSKYGFSFKYPNDWSIETSKGEILEASRINPPGYEKCIKSQQTRPSMPCSGVIIEVVTNFEKLGLEDYLKNEMGWNYEGAYKDLKKLESDGVIAYSLISVSGYDGTENLQFWVPLSDKNFFVISGSYLSESENELMKKIFDSFMMK